LEPTQRSCLVACTPGLAQPSRHAALLTQRRASVEARRHKDPDCGRIAVQRRGPKTFNIPKLVARRPRSSGTSKFSTCRRSKLAGRRNTVSDLDAAVAAAEIDSRSTL